MPCAALFPEPKKAGDKIACPTSFPRELLVRSQVQLQHIDARLAQETQIRPFGKLPDELIHLVHSNATGFRDPRRLRPCRVGRKMRIQAAGRSGHQIRRKGSRVIGIILPKFVDRGFHPIDELLTRRPVVRPARSGRIISIVAGRRRPRLEIFRLGEVLSDQFRSDRFAAGRDQAPVGLMREQNLSRYP